MIARFCRPAKSASDTFKPYNPAELIGDTAPTLPVPQNDDDCGFLGQLIMIVVAVVVTYFTAGAATGVWGSDLGVGWARLQPQWQAQPQPLL